MDNKIVQIHVSELKEKHENHKIRKLIEDPTIVPDLLIKSAVAMF